MLILEAESSTSCIGFPIHSNTFLLSKHQLGFLHEGYNQQLWIIMFV